MTTPQKYTGNSGKGGGSLQPTLHSANIVIDRSPRDAMVVKFEGDWIITNGLPDVEEFFSNANLESPGKQISFDCSNLGRWDSGFLNFVRSLIKNYEEQKITVNTSGLPDGVNRLLKLASEATKTRDNEEEVYEESFLTRIGSASIWFTISTAEMLEFIGNVFLSLIRFIRGKARFRRIDLIQFIQESGPHALSIVLLINFLIGVILAFVGAVQLSQFGAQIYVADLVGIAMVREVAPLMTAIIASGRSGAAFAAQIGTMMVNEEIDALETMGFNPMEFLVLPRLIALFLMLPILTLFGDFMGILGGAVIGMGMLDITFTQYFEQTRGVLSPLHFSLGLFKSAIYGILVAIAGCYQGIKCGRSASAVGAATTAAVVTGIVYIIVAAAITTVLYSMFGL